MSLDKELRVALNQRREQHRYRQRALVAGAQQPRQTRDGRELISFCSNDYLGLANHPQVIDRLQGASAEFGVGSGASHLVNGHSEVHHQLEAELAAYTGRERALLFSTGYMANLGVINALCGRGDLVLEDKLNHASLLDGGLIASADMQRYAHNDMAHLEKRLQKTSARRRLIVTDGVFSMDGDLANLPDMVNLAQDYCAHVMVDDAHGLGVMGEQGKGSTQFFGVNQAQVPVLMGTLGKAFGTFGAFVAGSEALIETLIQFARTYIYTTALPPAVAAATRESLAIVQSTEGDSRRVVLSDRVAQFRLGCEELGLVLMDSFSPIQPLVIGSDKTAMQWSEALLERGFWVTAIRPPTVPEGTARLRFTFSAEHSAQQVNDLLLALKQVQSQFPLEANV